jgi:hypothetical protein
MYEYGEGKIILFGREFLLCGLIHGPLNNKKRG